MTKSFTGRKRIRKTFGRIGDVAPMPNLIEVQKSSYDRFLQTGVMAPDRADSGLQEAFKTVFPISDFSGVPSLNSSNTNWKIQNTTLRNANSVA